MNTNKFAIKCHYCERDPVPGFYRHECYKCGDEILTCGTCIDPIEYMESSVLNIIHTNFANCKNCKRNEKINICLT